MENSPTDQTKHPSNLTEFRPDFKLYDIELCRDEMNSLCDAAISTSLKVSKQFDGLPVPSQKNKEMKHVHDVNAPTIVNHHDPHFCRRGAQIVTHSHRGFVVPPTS